MGTGTASQAAARALSACSGGVAATRSGDADALVMLNPALVRALQCRAGVTLVTLMTLMTLMTLGERAALPFGEQGRTMNEIFRQVGSRVTRVIRVMGAVRVARGREVGRGGTYGALT